jgi:prepilin-type N-terminal cleavage/methylation domain-containing protein
VKRGWTMVETLVVLAIVVLLSGILFPVFVRAKQSGEISVCTTALRQVGQAIAAYRMEYDGQGVLGPQSQMGLPPVPISESLPVLFRLSHQCKGKARVPGLAESGLRYRYISAADNGKVGFESWTSYVQRHGESAIIALDHNHNPSYEVIDQPYATKTVLGVALDTSVRRLNRKGLPFDMTNFWHEQP